MILTWGKAGKGGKGSLALSPPRIFAKMDFAEQKTESMNEIMKI
jgi:hypothetical protein